MKDLQPHAARPTPRQARHKIVGPEELAALTLAARTAGRRVVLAHGVFDLLHMGHVRHLEAARREGNMLVVSLTADAYVNKGPGRPVFPERLRAEMVGSLEYVDWVVINEAATAEDLLRTVRPDVYVKGAEYRNPEGDVTGKIGPEQEAVEAHGGRIVFTDDITFSSSHLINRYMDVHDPDRRHYLERLREGEGQARLLAALEGLKPLKVLFVGDAIIDEYQYVTAMGKSAKENIIATHFQERELFAGGVFAAANHLASFCETVDVLTVLGGADSRESVAREALKPNVGLHVTERPGTPTTRKTRFVDDYSLRKLFEVYHMDDSLVDGTTEAEVLAFLDQNLAGYDVVAVTDFGHGLMTPAIMDRIVNGARFLGVNVQTNSANLGFNLATKWSRADFMSLDNAEARLVAGARHHGDEDLVGKVLPRIIPCPRLVVTHGRHGSLAWSREEDGVTRVPALTSEVKDPVGAGDAFFALATPLAALGYPMDVVTFLGNAAGAMKVGIIGHRAAVEKVALIKFLTAMLR